LVLRMPPLLPRRLLYNIVLMVRRKGKAVCSSPNPKLHSL
jgi:hypothetical protein